MKLYGSLLVCLAVILLTAPFIAFLCGEKTNGKGVREESTAEIDTGIPSEKTSVKAVSSDTVRVFMTKENTVSEMSLKEYITGVVAAEMPASYGSEALKAQALVAVTYIRYRQRYGGTQPSGADVSDDGEAHQGYVSPGELQDRWGDAYESFYDKISDAVDCVLDEVITYNGEPVMAAYHAISPGRTESAENIWGEEVEYLVSVDSEWDIYSSRYSSEVRLSAEDFRKSILSVFPDAVFPVEKEEWIRIDGKSSVGTVLDARVCGTDMTGMEISRLFGLRSPAFSVKYEDGEFIFSVSGYGHGVGMSQNGANRMAENGCSYKEIINHYYPGAEIV